MYKQLTSYQLAELWSQIELVKDRLSTAVNFQNVTAMYCACDDLDTLRRRMQVHYVAVDIAKGECTEDQAFDRLADDL